VIVVLGKEKKRGHEMAGRAGLAAKVEELVGYKVGTRGSFGGQGQWHCNGIVDGAIGSVYHRIIGMGVFWE